MGPLIPDHMEAFQKNPRFIGMRFPEMNKPETLEKRYLGKLSKKAMAFMKDCLKMDPNQRITAAKALQHPYFDDVRETTDVIPTRQEMRIESANIVTTTNTQMSVSVNPKPPIQIQDPQQNQYPTQNLVQSQSKAPVNNTLNSQTSLIGQKSIQQININTNKPIDAITAEQQY